MKALNASVSLRSLTRLLVSCSALVLGTSGVSQAADDPQPKDLRLFYQQNCASCHGADGAAKDATGKNLRGQDFTDEAWIKGASDVKMVKVILSGKFFGFAMPSFKNSLTKEESQQMVTEIVRKCKKGKTVESAPKATGPAT